ncbi:MAG: winged helix-turn-helix transcriptional regulator [Muribaculaceae bacterium]|nr:winged helix-turn-helix transcriptional regulator [Muribaculaceae bacterium]
MKDLESDGLITRKVYAEIPPRGEYSFTTLGKSLNPLIGNLVARAIDNYVIFHKKC